MKVLLVSSNTERLNMPTMPLGLALVAAATRQAGHQVRFLDLLDQDDPGQAVKDAISGFDPEVIGVSVRNIDNQEMSAPVFLLAQVRPIIEQCRASSGAPVVLGGTGYSIFPQELLEYLGAEYGIAGDGERVFPALLERLARNEDPSGLAGLYTASGQASERERYPADLDDLPLPDPDQWAYLDPRTENLWVPVQSRRGCPNQCAYCSTSLIQGRAIRSRSPELVAESVGRMARAGFKRFYFVDNSFNIPEPYALELCQRLQRLGLDIEWRCILYPHRVSQELVRAMREAGCVEVALGFESGCEPVLRLMNKHFTPAEVREASEMLAAHRIRRMGFLLLGAPGETRDSVEESLAFARSLDLDILRITVGVRIYPGTALAEIAAQEGVIDPRESLLSPRFYLAPGLDPWISQRVEPGVAVKPGPRAR